MENIEKVRTELSKINPESWYCFLRCTFPNDQRTSLHQPQVSRIGKMFTQFIPFWHKQQILFPKMIFSPSKTALNLIKNMGCSFSGLLLFSAVIVKLNPNELPNSHLLKAHRNQLNVREVMDQCVFLLLTYTL